MKFNAQWAMDKLMKLNPLSMFQKKLSNNALFFIHLNEFIKVTKLVVVQIIWDPWFFNLHFHENKSLQ